MSSSLQGRFRPPEKPQALDDPIGQHGVSHFLEARDVRSFDIVNCALGERYNGIVEVVGSIPSGSTINVPIV